MEDVCISNRATWSYTQKNKRNANFLARKLLFSLLFFESLLFVVYTFFFTISVAAIESKAKSQRWSELIIFFCVFYPRETTREKFLCPIPEEETNSGNMIEMTSTKYLLLAHQR